MPLDCMHQESNLKVLPPLHRSLHAPLSRRNGHFSCKLAPTNKRNKYYKKERKEKEKQIENHIFTHAQRMGPFFKKMVLELYIV